MELIKLKENVRRHYLKENIHFVSFLATAHNLIKRYETKDWEGIQKKMHDFIVSYNVVIEEMNKIETPIEDKIIELEKEIERLENNNKQEDENL